MDASTLDKLKSVVTALKTDPPIDSELLVELSKEAILAKQKAYCPYSRFRVGSAILAFPASVSSNNDKPSMFTGVNVENASYPVGICAERCAVSKAVSEGFTSVIAVAVSTDITPPASPCGMCRQFLREFSDLDMPVIMFGGKSEGEAVAFESVEIRTLEELLPLSFTGGDLSSRVTVRGDIS